MGQACSCRHPRGRKLQRRSSDASPSLTRLSGAAAGSDDDDGSDDSQEEIDILIDDDMERDALLSSSSSATVAGTRQSVSSAATMTKRASKSQLRDDAVMTAFPSRRASPSTLAVVLPSDTKATDSAAALAPMQAEHRQHLDALLRSYQRATGVVDHGQLDLECVMCLDTFSDDNPKVRSLCNCGVNRTNFHLSCLLEWLDRDPNCPVCRAYLFYEEL